MPVTNNYRFSVFGFRLSLTLLLLCIPSLAFSAKLTVPDNLIGKRTLYLVPQDSAPAGAEEGQIYFNGTENQLYYHNGTTWTVLSGGGGDKVVGTRVVAAVNSLEPERADPAYVCDGVNDEQTIQAAIDSLAPNRGAVYLLEGTYNISSSINFESKDSGKAIIGTGSGTVLKVAPGTSNVNVINAVDVDRILISQLMIDGNSKTGSNNNGIYFDNVTYSKIDKVWVEELSYFGIYLYSSSNNNTITSNTVQGNAGWGIHLASFSNNNTITSNTVQGNSIGIHLWSSSNNTITSNTVQGNGSSGIYFVSSSNNNTITSNTVQGNAGFGIYIVSLPNNNTITNNSVQGNGGDGIRLRGSSNNTITSNSVQGNGWDGIYLVLSSSNNTITSNVVYDNGGSGNYGGMRIEDNSDNNLVSSNLLYDSSGTGRPINIASADCNNTYLVGNLISSWPASYKEISDSGTTTRYTQKEKITIERQTVVEPANGDTLDVTTSPKGYIPLLPAAPITLNATTAIADGKAVGDLLILEGRSDTNTVTIPNNANTRLGAATRVLGLEDTLKLLWNGTDWLEMAYSDN